MSPFFQVIVNEAARLPDGFLASVGHVSDVLGQPVHTDEGLDALVILCGEYGLDVEHDGNDGLRFTVRTEAHPTPEATEKS